MGTLSIVATPIGNLDDITLRAVRVLQQTDIILAEDTRHSRHLLSHLGIEKQMVAYHDHNKERMTPTALNWLSEGRSLAQISDAGTPGIADPAFFLVRAAIAAGHSVIPVPGACAAIAALVGSGLPTDRFIFENFLPPKSGKRRTLFSALIDEHRTVIFYESPHRIVRCLEDIEAILGGVQVVIGRELTKIHEEFLRGRARELITHFEQHPPRGEMVVLLNPRIVVKDDGDAK
jgi:16S rRNA (cytidine1402-2'-O)-methyltransferase